MFEFYLCGSELAFRRAGHMVFQIQLAHQQTAVPLTRDYITESERAVDEIAGRRLAAGLGTMHLARIAGAVGAKRRGEGG